MEKTEPLKPGSQHPKKKRKGLFLRILLYFVATLAILLMTGFLFLQTETARNAVRALIEQTAARHLAADLRVEKISGSLLFDIALEGIEISQAGLPVVKIQRLSAGYLPFLLVAGIVHLHEVEIEGLFLNLAREEDGRLDIAARVPAAKSSGAEAARQSFFTFQVRRLSVSDGAVVFTDRQSESVVARHFSNVQFAAGLKLSSSGTLSVRVIEFGLDLDNPVLHLAGLTGSIRYTPERNRLDLKNLRLRLKESVVTVNGNLDLDPDGVHFDFKTALNPISFSEFGQLLSVPVPGQGVLSGTLQLKGTPRQILYEADLELDGMGLSSNGTLAWSGPGSLNTHISASIRHLNPAVLNPAVFSRLDGDISSDILFQGENIDRADRKGHLIVNLKPSRVSGHELGAGRFEADFESNRIRIKDSSVSAAQGEIRIHQAFVDLPGPARTGSLNLTASVQGFNPAISGVEALSGKVNMDFAVKAMLAAATGTGIDPLASTAEVSADIGSSSIQSLRIDRGKIEAVWSGQSVEIRKLKLSLADGQLAATGNLDPVSRDAQLHFNVDLPEIEPVTRTILQFLSDKRPAEKKEYPKGRFNLNGKFNGWWDRFDLSLAANAGNFRYDQVFGRNVDLKGALKGSPEDFMADVQVYAQDLDLAENRMSRVDLGLKLFPEKALVDLAVQHQKGPSMKIKGSVDGWRRTDKSILIDTFGVSLAEGYRDSAGRRFEDINNSGPIRLIFSNSGAIEIAAFKLVSEETELSLTGRLDASERIQANLFIDRLDLKRLPRLIEIQDRLSGILSADLALAGTLARPILTARLKATEAVAYDQAFSALDLFLAYRDERAVFKAGGYVQQLQRLDAGAETGMLFSLKPFKIRLQENRFKASINARGMRLSDLSIFKKEGVHYDGTLSLNIQARGDLRAPLVRGSLSVTQGFIASEKTDPRDYAFSEFKVDLQYRHGRADFGATLYRQQQKLLSLNGETGVEFSLVPFHFKLLENGLKLEAAAHDFKFSMLPIPRIPGIDFDARLNLAVTATGQLLQPAVRGSLSLEDGFLNLKKQALSYETVNARIDFSGREVNIKKLLLKGDKEGSLALNGRIRTDGFKPAGLDIHLTGDNVYIPYHKAVTARIRPDLRLGGTWHAPRLSGTLTILDGRINLDQLSSRGPAEIQVLTPTPAKGRTIEIVEEGGAEHDFIRLLAADVAVAASRNVWLKGQDINAEIAGEIHLKKEAEKPFILTGALHTVRGSFEFQNRFFKVTRGSVDFIGLEEINPNLDILAETRIGRVTIIVKLTGTADRMVLDLGSEPLMDRTDIISYLVFGRPARELTQQQSFNAEQAALNLTGRLAVKELKNILGDAFNLDVLTLESSDGDLSRGALAVGKYVTPEIFVLYRHRFKADESDQVEITYEINRNFSIETQLGDEKTTGIDFVLNFDF